MLSHKCNLQHSKWTEIDCTRDDDTLCVVAYGVCALEISSTRSASITPKPYMWQDITTLCGGQIQMCTTSRLQAWNVTHHSLCYWKIFTPCSHSSYLAVLQVCCVVNNLQASGLCCSITLCSRRIRAHKCALHPMHDYYEEGNCMPVYGCWNLSI